jgi:succinate-semialdehyde dehydrogenase/glutarate-semialdehyde dehydrogenase
MRCIADAGIPGDAAQLVYGNPDMISRHLLGSPVIRKVSFTGSTAVGKHLMKLAADNVQRITMELGGHAPVLIFDDCHLDATLDRVVAQKFRNAGQVCVSPTRFYVQQGIYDAFVKGFAERTAKVRVGSGLDANTQMGPLANERRIPALEAMIADATAKGARVVAGGGRGEGGYFFQPTALADVPIDADAMVSEPFGPMALIRPFAMVGINSFVISSHDMPFGGIKQSGFGSESGPEGLDGYLVTKAVHIY